MKMVFSRKSFTVWSLLLTVLFSTSSWAVDTFTMSYEGKGGRSGCNSTFAIYGEEPSEAGTYPVYVYTVGTWEDPQSVLAMANITEMANRGYVAASVAYDNNSFGDCSKIGGRAECIYDATSSSSAVSRLCSRAKADCSKGIVAGGLSQGSVVATLGKNWDARVQAVYGTGIGVKYDRFDLTACMADGNRTLSSDRLRAVNGEVDNFFGENPDDGRANLEALTGLSCGSDAYSCFRTNSSGWYMVQNSEVSDGEADHCYMMDGGCSSTNPLDPTFENGTESWSLGTNLDWLTNFTQ